MADRGGLAGLTVNRPDTAYVKQRGMGGYTRRKNTEPIYGPHTLQEDYRDARDTEMQARLYEESVGFPNLAGQREVVEQARYAVMAGLKDVFNVMEFLRNKWLILYRLYRGETINDYTYGRLQLHSPEPFKIFETIHPRMMRTVYGTEAWFRLYAEAAEHDANSRAQEAMCREQFRAMRYYAKASRNLRDGLIYGTSIQKLWWKQQIEHRAYRMGRRVPDPKRPGASKVKLEEVKRKELVFDGNFIDNVSVFDFLAPPNASDMDSAEWCADRSMWPDYKVKEMGELGHWINLEPLRDHPGTNDSSFGDEFKERKSYAYGVFDPREASHAPHIPHYQVIDWWGPLVIRNEEGSYETRQCNVVMIEPEGPAIIARITVNPFWHGEKPYQVWKPIDLEDEFYGIGPIEMIARLSREKDMKRQLLMAATQLESNPMLLVSDEANIPGGQFVAQPGLVIRVPDVTNSVAPLHVPKVSDSALKAENVLTMDIRETAGTTSPSMGTSDPFGGGSKTASQHNAEIDMANLRISDMIMNYENQVLDPMLSQMAWNNQQFASLEKVIRDVGPVGIRFQDRYTIRPEDLIGRFIVKPLASYRLLTKSTQVQQLTNLLDRIPLFAQIYGPQSIKGPAILAHVLEHGFDIRNADDFIATPPEDSKLLTALEEHELWYHGKVPPRRADDNDLRHALSHLNELGSERFAQLDSMDVATAARARAHIADHLKALAMKQENQEKRLMEAMQAATAMNIEPPPMHGQGLQGNEMGRPPEPGNVPGAGGPGQAPTSPNVRRNEMERGEEGSSQGSVQSEAMGRAPNPGAS